ncbi:MAG: glycosyltransferase family 4 protein [Candidatus Omnitrophota bacterium]
MKAVFIEPSGAGGIAHYTQCLAGALGAHDIPCEILTSRRWISCSPLPNAAVHKIFRGMRTNPLEFYRHALRLRRDASLIHWQCAARPAILLWIMRLFPLKRIPWIYTVHNILPHERRSSSQALFEKIYRRMDGLIFHTQHTQREFQRIFPNVAAASAVIPHGEYGFLTSETAASSPVEENALLFFGNIRPYKGLDILLNALVDVKKIIPGVKLLIAGQALEPFDRYEKIIARHGLNEVVEKRLEYIPDEEIAGLIASSAIVVLPYREIDQSGVLLLAMASGKPVVASRIGGIPEAIQDGETGVLVPPEDAKSLAQAIVNLLQNPSKRAAMGAAARQDVLDRFSWNRIAEQTIQFYETLM